MGNWLFLMLLYAFFGWMKKKQRDKAREKIERLLGQRVFLALHVKVVKQWTRKKHHLQALGYQ